MKKSFHLSHVKWLIAALSLLALLALSLTRVETGAARGYPKPTNTPTLTPTPPALQHCQVREITFEPEQAEYQVGDTIQITLWLADHRGEDLVGANVDVVVTRQPVAAQAIVLPDPLEDQSGSYVGDYTFELPGDFTFKFTANDSTGKRFLPCTAEKTVRVEPKPQCEIFVDPPEDTQYNLNQTIVLTADVRVDDEIQSGAVVTATVARPDNQPDFLSFTGNGPYIGQYPHTNVTGSYTFTISASDPSQRFEPCTATRRVEAIDIPQCEITLTRDPQPEYVIGETINLTATVTERNGANAAVRATIQIPNDGSEQIPLVGSGDIYVGSYTPIVSGTYTITATAEDATGGQNFMVCTANPITAPVVGDSPSLGIRIEPLLREVDLCGQVGDTNSQVVVEGVSNLAFVDLEIHYDPTVMQVIDANPGLSGVQVRFNPNLSPSQNRVDTSNGRIFFTATAFTLINGSSNLITIDWRPVRGPGLSPITFETVTLRNASGQPINALPQDGAVNFFVGEPCHLGQATVQGRTDHSGITVTSSGGEQTQTLASGFFAIHPADSLSLTFPGYLSGYADLRQQTPLASSAGEAAGLGTINLLAGDINSDNLIDILDLAYIAGLYSSTDATADLNADGLVDILDLALVAGNYQQQGPLTGWK